MGRAKIDTTRELETDSKKRSTFKQRGSGLEKKFMEMGTLCDVEEVLIAHGPHEELIHFCHNTSMANLYQRYIESKYKEKLPLPDVNSIRLAIAQREGGHVQEKEKLQLDVEFAEQMKLIPMEESMILVTMEELETLHEDHIGLVARAVEANLEALRKFQKLQTRCEPRIVEGMVDGVHTPIPREIGSTSIREVSAVVSSMQETNYKQDEHDEQGGGKNDGQVNNQPTRGINVEQQTNDIYTPISDDPDKLLVYNPIDDDLFGMNIDDLLFDL